MKAKFRADDDGGELLEHKGGNFKGATLSWKDVTYSVGDKPILHV